MKFELTTLEEYSDEALLSELRRVAGLLQGERLTHQRFNALSRVHSTTLRCRFGSWNSALDKAGISESIAPRFKVLSREAVLLALREFATERPGESVTEEALGARLGHHKGTITRRFGKWSQLLSEAGLPPVPLGRRYTDEECYENILTLWTHYGRQPAFSELKKTPSTVGPKAYTGRWGKWRVALSSFIKRINESGTSAGTPESFTQELQAGETNALDVRIPRSIPLSIRYKVLSRDRFRCVACGSSPAKDGSTELHVDHIHPWSRGGQNDAENLQTLCFRCNLGKGDSI